MPGVPLSRMIQSFPPLHLATLPDVIEDGLPEAVDKRGGRGDPPLSSEKVTKEGQTEWTDRQTWTGGMQKATCLSATAK